MRSDDAGRWSWVSASPSPQLENWHRYKEWHRGLRPIVFGAVRAACIALDAEVAYADRVAVPERLQQAQSKRGERVLPAYHVIKVRHRAPTPASVGVETTPRRLHLVRGYWSMHRGRRLWTKWHLRGDEDLGFIDKHYRL